MAKEPTKPRIVIFDLDDTLIHEGFEDYAHLGEMLLFKEVKSVLEYLKEKGHTLAIASHNEQAEFLLKSCNIHHFFEVVVGYCPPSFEKMPLVEDVLKCVQHMETSDVVFFDDLYENVTELKRKGIRAKMVSWEHGITHQDLREMDL